MVRTHLIVFALVFMAWTLFLGSELQNLGDELDNERVLRKRAENLVTTLTNSLKQHEIPSPSLTPTTRPPPRDIDRVKSEAPSLTKAGHPSTSDTWYINQRIADIEDHTVLSAEEKNSLSNALANKPKIDLESSEGKELVAEILGNKRATAFIAARVAQRAKDAAENIETKLFKLSRTLSLTSSQLPAIRNIITEVEGVTLLLRENLHKQVEEVNAKHTLSTDDKDSLRNSYEAMKGLAKELRASERALYQQKLRSILTDEQYNAYLAAEASDLHE